MVQSFALDVFHPTTVIRQRQQSQPYLMHTSPSRCRLADGASPWQGLAASLEAVFFLQT